ncbi:MAG: N-acetylneuraminate synthase family protein [Candidatus Hodarchaeales archaeon]
MQSYNPNGNVSYIIGETAYNHEGDIDYLFRMIDDISELKLFAIKFHLLLNPESYMQIKHPLVKTLKKWIFSKAQWEEIIDYSINKDLDVIALCDDVESCDYLLDRGKQINSLELHAVSINDHFLLDSISNFDGRIILGVGGATLEEIKYAITFLKNRGKNDILLMYGFQSYPTNYQDINLSKMIKLRDFFGLPVGYADHTAFDDPHNVFISVLGAAMGFNILEKHYTPDVGKERIDYHAAVGKDQMKEISLLMDLVLDVYGSGSVEMSPAEKNYGNIGPMKKAIVAKKDILRGMKLSFDNLWFKRTQEESNIQQNQFLQMIGLEASVDIKSDEVIDFSKIKYQFQKMSEQDFTNIEKSRR